MAINEGSSRAGQLLYQPLSQCTGRKTHEIKAESPVFTCDGVEIERVDEIGVGVISLVVTLMELESECRMSNEVVIGVVRTMESKSQGSERFYGCILLVLFRNRNTRNRRYSCSFGTYSGFGMNGILFRSFCSL